MQGTYQAKSSLSKALVQDLLSQNLLNQHFVPDLLGRPNFWCSELHETKSPDGSIEAVDFFCQHPRYAIHRPGSKRKSPVLTYMRNDAIRNCTLYIFAGPADDEYFDSFKEVMNAACCSNKMGVRVALSFRHALEPHLLMSKITCDSSQKDIDVFRRWMFAQVFPVLA